jgi:hypothetical protein
MDFESLIQNLFESCRELIAEQLLFWGQILKMPFSSSKFEFRMV